MREARLWALGTCTAEFQPRNRDVTAAGLSAGLDPDMNVPEFQDMLVAHSGVVVEDQELLVGYPPKAVEVSLVTELSSDWSCATAYLEFRTWRPIPWWHISVQAVKESSAACYLLSAAHITKTLCTLCCSSCISCCYDFKAV